MLLAVDVGNTNITLGVFEDSVIVGNFRLNTRIARTSDEYGIAIRNILYNNGIDHDRIKDCIIASVVPAVMHSLTSAVIKYFDTRPLVVAAGVRTGINIQTEVPSQIGADRIVDAAGAYELYGGPLIVIDFGTATTYDYVDEKGSFRYGVTAPGIRIAAKALWEDAAKLPEIEIVKPKSILARETISSMQAGLVFGQIGATEYIINHMKDEIGKKNIKVIATGGLGKMISGETDCIDLYNPDLTLQGMRFIYEKQDR
ncbi:type III pantothenate kinase [Candidatus Weimeria sp. HCP3S3_B5]|uniref:type III pantothenate kinase n=1 Tax=Candidatus Weimeria sp. HCP3S3_B5 TaxID=3438871 RepID=UPI003021458E|nr:type III pantothenate kinase [Lachnospiraceae bacterium]